MDDDLKQAIDEIANSLQTVNLLSDLEAAAGRAVRVMKRLQAATQEGSLIASRTTLDEGSTKRRTGTLPSTRPHTLNAIAEPKSLSQPKWLTLTSIERRS